MYQLFKQSRANRNNAKESKTKRSNKRLPSPLTLVCGGGTYCLGSRVGDCGAMTYTLILGGLCYSIDLMSPLHEADLSVSRHIINYAYGINDFYGYTK